MINKALLKNKLLISGYILNLLVSIIWPLLALVIIAIYHHRAYEFITELMGFTMIAVVAVSLLARSAYLKVLSVFCTVLFLNAFIHSKFSAQFIHMIYVVYAILTALFIYKDNKNMSA